MRKRWLFLFPVVLVSACWAWPLIGAYQLARFAERRDSAAVAARVDFSVLRRSLASQVVRAYLRRTGRGEKMGPLASGLLGSASVSVADPYLADMISPEALTRLLGDGTVAPINVENRVFTFDRTFPRFADVLQSGNALSVLLASHYEGLGKFVVHVPALDEGQDSLGIHFRLSQASWQLAGVDLPEPLVDRLVDDIVLRMKTKSGA